MSKLTEAYLIDDGGLKQKSKDDYIVEAEEGTIVAFRLNFESSQKVALTKVISGMILDNDEDEEKYVVETRNGLKYGVPYDAVVWVKTGTRWPKGVYEEMKRGSVPIEDLVVEEVELEEDEETDFEMDGEGDELNKY